MESTIPLWTLRFSSAGWSRVSAVPSMIPICSSCMSRFSGLYVCSFEFSAWVIFLHRSQWLLLFIILTFLLARKLRSAVPSSPTHQSDGLFCFLYSTCHCLKSFNIVLYRLTLLVEYKLHGTTDFVHLGYSCIPARRGKLKDCWMNEWCSAVS